MSTNQQDLLDIAVEAERDLNSNNLKRGERNNQSLSTDESGIDQNVEQKFPGSTADYGSHVSGAGNNRDIPPEQGGDFQRGTGRLTKAGDFDQGEAGEGPEDIAERRAREYGGEDDIRSNIRQGTGGDKRTAS